MRNTLPEKIFEDRLVYVLNRIDECSSLEDLIRVYGTLCWNLSQITGRKDIPRILLTYSTEKAKDSHEYLKYLTNQVDFRSPNYYLIPSCFEMVEFLNQAFIVL